MAIDILGQPTYTFTVTEEGGYEGLKDKPVFVAYSRGSNYPLGSGAEGFDFQTKYLRTILGFMGLTDVRTLVIEPTLAGGPDVGKQRPEAAIAKAREMAKSF